jgi:hypothetical protein
VLEADAEGPDGDSAVKSGPVRDVDYFVAEEWLSAGGAESEAMGKGDKREE